jgi:hypothetical protein
LSPSAAAGRRCPARLDVVSVDDVKAKPACLAPCVLELSQGHQVLYFTRAGYQPSQLEVEVRAKQSQSLEPQLVALRGSLVVSTDEPGALIEVDERPNGFTPLVLSLPVASC